MKSKEELFSVLSTGYLQEENFDVRNPMKFVVSLEEYEQLKAEHSSDVEGLSYEEYCELERECWNQMYQMQLIQPWEKSIPESLLNPELYIIQERHLTKKPRLRSLILKAMQKGVSVG